MGEKLASTTLLAFALHNALRISVGPIQCPSASSFPGLMICSNFMLDYQDPAPQWGPVFLHCSGTKPLPLHRRPFRSVALLHSPSSCLPSRCQHPAVFDLFVWLTCPCPFRMHNGVVGGFMKIRRMLLSHLSDAAYDTIQSFHSDSAICFAVFLHHLPDLTSLHPSHTILKAIEVPPSSHCPSFPPPHCNLPISQLGPCPRPELAPMQQSFFP